jgi:hypothetical protein
MTSRVVAREAPTRDRQFHPPETSSTAPLTQRELADVQCCPFGGAPGATNAHQAYTAWPSAPGASLIPMARRALWLFLLTLAWNDRGNFLAHRQCVCELPDGGSALVHGYQLYCDWSADDVQVSCSKQDLLGAGGCVSLSACSCELGRPGSGDCY